MKSYIIDCETVPASTEFLESRMPEEIRNPVMPENLANPPDVDYSAVPKYASIKDETERMQKQADWCLDKKQKHERSAQEARQKWQLGAMEARTRFVQNAALDAKLGHVKLIGMQDAETGFRYVYLWEDDPKQQQRISNWIKSESFPEKLSIIRHRNETAMLAGFFDAFRTAMEGDPTDTFATSGKCVTFYGNVFDFPFLYRRAWVLGIHQPPMFRRGRYWDDSRMVDLHECWQMGVRDEKTGGLDNLAAALGYERAKLHDGANFHRIYEDDPTEGITYNLNDLDQTAFVARRMGIIR